MTLKNRSILTPIHLMTTPVLFLAFLASILTCFAQEAPTLSLEIFNYSTSFRQSVCDRQAQIDNETLQLRDALKGLQLSTWMYKDNRYVNFLDDGDTNVLDPNDPGLIPDLLDELATRAGFTWRDSFGIIENITLPQGKTFTDLLVWSVWATDVSAAYWSRSLGRMDLGVSFPEGWYDGRIIMIGVEPGGTSNLDLWSFLEPFTTGVWIMIIATIIVSAGVYWFLDWYDTESDEMRLGNKPGQNLFLAAITFTGQFEFKPASNSARIFTASLAVWSLIVMSAYTANLASFLVVQNTPSITIDTVGDAVRNNYRLCLIENTIAQEAVTRTYPSARLVKSPSEEDTYKQLREGMCDIALNTVSSWEEYRLNREVNDDCRLTWIGRSFTQGEGGFATKSDSGTLCTSLIRDVFNLHLLEMKDNGDIQRAWEAHLRKQASVNCDAATDDETESDGQLSLKAMGGTFIIHYIATAFAIFLAVVAQLYHHKSVCKPVPTADTQASRKRGETVEQSPSNDVNDGPDYLEDGPTVAEQSTYQGLQDVILGQNEQLAALSKQNAEMIQMISALKNGSVVAAPQIETAS